MALARSPKAGESPGWRRPVSGAVARRFDYAPSAPFARGRHRGVDFAARAGESVHAACAGRVAFAGTAGASGPTVSVRCGPWRVTYLPLRSLAVRGGARVRRGARLGTAAGGGPHLGLHVGVRRDGRRWAYVDPLPFFGSPSGWPPVGVAPPALRRSPPARVPEVAPRALRRPSLGRLPWAAPAARHAPAWARHGVPDAPSRGERPHARPDEPTSVTPALPRLAPWPAWVGLGLALAGASGSRLAIARRRRRHAMNAHTRRSAPAA